MENGDLFSVHMAMVLAFELPDLDADNASGKTVLAVRIGGTTTRRIIGLLLLTPIVLVATAVASDSLTASTWWEMAAAMVPEAVVVHSARHEQHVMLTASAVATLVGLALGLLVV